MNKSGYVLAAIGAAIAVASYLFRFPLRIGLNGHYFEPWLLLKILGLIVFLLGMVLIIRGWIQPRLSG